MRNKVLIGLFYLMMSGTSAAMATAKWVNDNDKGETIIYLAFAGTFLTVSLKKLLELTKE